jgi:hypothetical protein
MGSVPEPTLDNVEIIGFEVTDLRFPTSLDGVGSDAMHVGTNGSHPYVRLLTNHAGLVGEGIVSSSSSSSPPILLPTAMVANSQHRPSATAAAANSSPSRWTSSRAASCPSP